MGNCAYNVTGIIARMCKVVDNERPYIVGIDSLALSKSPTLNRIFILTIFIFAVVFGCFFYNNIFNSQQVFVYKFLSNLYAFTG